MRCLLAREQTMLEVEVSYVNKEGISRYITLDNNRQWFPFISDDVVPGLLSILEYLELNYAAITSLQDAITDMSNRVQTEIDNIGFPTNPNASKIIRHHYYIHERSRNKKVSNRIHDKSNHYNFYNDTFNFKEKIIM